MKQTLKSTAAYSKGSSHQCAYGGAGESVVCHNGHGIRTHAAISAGEALKQALGHFSGGKLIPSHAHAYYVDDNHR